MFLLDRPSTHWWLDGVVLFYVLKTAFIGYFSSRRERRARISLPPVTGDWLREHARESAKRGT